MRKLFFLLMIMVLPLGFTACGSDDDDEQTDELRADPNFNPIKGEWIGSGTRYYEKLVFTSDFGYERYSRPSSDSKNWTLEYKGTYLINSKVFKTTESNSELEYLYINNQYEIVLYIRWGGETASHVYYPSSKYE